MKFYDISLPLGSKTPEWPGHIKFKRKEIKGKSITSELHLSSHYGTHIDAPKHFLFNKSGVDTIKPDSLIGVFTVVEVKSKNLISLADVKSIKIEYPQSQILFKTRNSKIVTKNKFTKDYVSLSIEAAEYLIKQKVALVGIDYFGMEAKESPGHPVHKALLAKGIVVVEGLDLSKVKPGKYDGAILPLKITGCDGSPARAILWN
jgi:arylformamidase